MAAKETIRCCRCKRPLHSRKARELGIGTTCARKNPAMLARILAEAEGQLDLFQTTK